MTENPNEAHPRKLKDLRAAFESQGRSQEGHLKQRKDTVGYAPQVAKGGLPSEAERVGLQNSLPRSKNVEVNASAAMQISDSRSQLKGSAGVAQSTVPTDFRAHLKPTKNPNIALNIGVSANSKTETKTNPALTETKGLGKVQTSSQGKANEAGIVSPTVHEDFKRNLDKALSGRNSPTPGTIFPRGQTTPLSPPPPPPFGKFSKDTTRSQSPNSPSTPKGATIPFGITQKPLKTHAQGINIGNLTFPKPNSGTSGSAGSNNLNLRQAPNDKFVRADSNERNNSQPPFHQKTTPISSPNSPDFRSIVANKKPNTLPLPPMPKSGQNRKVIDHNETDSGKSENWKSHHTQPSHHSPQIISAGGKKYRRLPPPPANRDTGPRKPPRLQSVDLTQFLPHASVSNETSPTVVRPTVIPTYRTNSRAESTAPRPVTMIPEWTEEDEAREAGLKAAAQQGGADDEDDYQNSYPQYVNSTQNWREGAEEQTKTDEETMEEQTHVSKKRSVEIAYESDDSDYENIDFINQ